LISSEAGTDVIPFSNQSLEYSELYLKVRGFSNKSKGWDSYHAGPVSETAVEMTILVLNEIEKIGVRPDWVMPTSDESILLQFKIEGETFKFEFESDGDIGLMIKPLVGDPEFIDLDAEGVSEIFTERCYAGM
jgi:hypothetical protein